MYGFIHCCLEDMVLQLFGEPAWREILNVAGIKLRGASFLMHQVYDDETTFKLVAAASQVSGLPMEVCLEEFGKHFLVYCQKNGYDQILRVLGSNLYDFLTNLDNLHDHLASIYPGMRAPSFRVTRNLESNGGAGTTTTTTTTTKPGIEPKTDNNNNNSRQLDGGHMSLAAGSMYLHYYSERKGLSPIVKGLVLAVAREFFSTDIVVTECKLLKPQLGHAHDHVVLKIDRRSQADIKLDEQTSQAVSQAAAEAAAQQVASLSPSPTQVITSEPTNGAVRNEQQAREHHHQQQLQHKTMLSSAYGDTMSKLASDSLINSEIMMRTFPFHVIFDRHFNLVQVGNALLRVTSLYWQRRQQQQQNSNRRRGERGRSGPGDKQQSNSEDLIKFGDLFSIVRPKIEFTFDAIADHTNQVFVVKTRPNVLNADYLRSVAEESGCATVLSSRYNASSGISGVPQTRPSQSLCPMSRMAMKRRSCAPRLTSSSGSQSSQQPPDGCGNTITGAETQRPSAGHHHQGGENDSGNELSAFNLLSLRLKGQMIILSGPIGLGDGAVLAQTNQDQSEVDDKGDENLGDNLGQQGPFCLYLCSPRVDHLDQLMECGVKMSDLALHDRARELMLMSHTHKEDREAVKKLDQATNDLKKMDTKLRQENKRTNEVLHNIFPAKIATLLSHGTKIESESFDLVTCLYSDIIGFTKMCGSENVRPIDIVRLLNTLYLQFDNLTNIHGVYKVETIGDAYVIVGGLPEPLEDHADRCVRMGLDMVKVIATVRSPADNQPIQMRIGIHSGPVMAGIVGIRVPRYSLFGNTTTLANQLETHGVGGKIHISSFTLKNLIERDRFVIEDNPNQISGFPFKTYFVTNYLGDQTELLKHEKILEEQLIKDFELMGNEVELVDDSSRGGIQSRQFEGADFKLADLNKSTTRAGDLSARFTTANEQLEAGSNLRQSGLQSGMSTRHNINNNNNNNNASSSAKESDALVLMDVEDGASRPPRTSTRTNDERLNETLPIGELVELSSKLSDEILTEALVRYSDLQTFERLLSLLTNQYTRSRLVACLDLKQYVELLDTPTGNQTTISDGPRQCLSCPFCLGDGQLALKETERNWIKLMAIAANVALTLTGNQTNTIGRVPDDCRPVPSLGKSTTVNSQAKPDRSPTTNLDEQNNLIAGMESSVVAFATAGDTSETIIRQANLATDRQLSQNERDSRRAPPPSPPAHQLQARDISKTKSPEALSEVIKREALPDRADICGRTGSIMSLRTASVTAAAVGSGGKTPTTTSLPTRSSQEQPTDIISSLELTLEGLRFEREGLAAQVRQLKQCLNKFGLADEQNQQDGITSSGSVLPGEPTVAPRPSGGESCGINRPLMLSSNIQRMKRMDTLKRRKINREQELQQQQSRAGSHLASPLSSASVAIYENSDESRGRQANSDLDACVTPLVVNPSLKQKTPLSGRQPQQSVLAYHQSPDVNNNLSRTQSGSSVGGGGAAILESAGEEVSIDETATEFDQTTISEGQRLLKQMTNNNNNNNGSIGSAVGSSNVSGARQSMRPVVAPGGKKQPDGREASSNSSQQQRTPLKQEQSATTTTTYIFQSVRSSLASLMNETVSPQRSTTIEQQQQQSQQDRRKRFSLNAFGMGLSAAIGSPFSSPKKTAQGRQQSVGERIDSVTRKTSEPRSHSSSSGGGNPAASYKHNQKNQSKGRWSSVGTPTSTKRQSSNSSGVGANTATNCSCLRSSGSDHSIESDDRMIK